ASAASRSTSGFSFAGNGTGFGTRAGATASPNAGNASAAGAAGAAGSGAANIIGTVAFVQGTTLYVTDTNGDTVKVTTTGSTTISKTVTGAVKDLTPGSTVVVRGVQSSDGVYAAQS